MDIFDGRCNILEYRVADIKLIYYITLFNLKMVSITHAAIKCIFISHNVYELEIITRPVIKKRKQKINQYIGLGDIYRRH